MLLFYSEKKIRLYFILILFYHGLVLKAQNLIPNPSFEFNTNENCLGCGIDTASTWLSCWMAPNFGSGAGAMYSNISIDSLKASIPNSTQIYNFFHTARTGRGKIILQQTGAVSNNLTDSIFGAYANYIHAKLIAPLIKGEQYIFTMYVGSGIDTVQNCAQAPACGAIQTCARNLGVHFSKNRFINYLPSGKLNANSQLSFNNTNFLTNFSGWVKVSAVYTAAGGEEYITIGNFDYHKDKIFEQIPPLFAPVYAAIIQ